MKHHLPLVHPLLLAAALAATNQAIAASTRSLELSDRADFILALINLDEFRPAIGLVADCELDLLNRCKPPRFQAGLFQDETTHLTFHSPFTDWKRVDLKVPEELPMTGVSWLINLEGVTNQDKLSVMAINLKQAEHRVAGAGAALPSDLRIRKIAQFVASQFGLVSSQQRRTLGTNLVLDFKVLDGQNHSDTRMIFLPQDGVVFLFILRSSAADAKSNLRRLEELVRTARFNYKPSNAAAITATRSVFRRTDPQSVLAGVMRLAALGEYSAAAQDLADLRVFLHGRLPGPHIDTHTASLPTYGVSLRNPDPSKWTLTTFREGSLTGLRLKGQAGTNEASLRVWAEDYLVLFGPQFLRWRRSIESATQWPMSCGRPEAAMLGSIESDRIITLNRSTAYEAVVTLPLSLSKARVQWIDCGDFGLSVLVVAESSEFDTKLAEFDRILNENLVWSNEVTAAQMASGAGSATQPLNSAPGKEH